jgi:tetratricopeptide (TPR) repeat protein
MNRPPTRELRTIAWALALAALGALLAFVPLFDVLGYESCLALALAGSFAAAHLGAATVWRARHDRAGSDALAAEAAPLRAVLRLYLSSLSRAWLVLAGPLVILLANALRVRNCDLDAGLQWFAMLPLLSAANGAALGVVVGLVRDWRRRVIPTLLALAAIVGSIAYGVWRFYAAPPIFGYDPFVGYFAGTLYDEEVTITAAFGWARVYQLLVAASALVICARQLDGATLSLRRYRPERVGVRALTIVLVLVSFTMWLERARLGFQLDAGDLARALGAEKRTAHFVLHYSPRGPYAKDIELYAADDEFRWAELERTFGRAPTPPVHAFLFDNADEKRRLMGAGHTFIAKPWRREIYLQFDGWPQEVTAHELAHVFAGSFGDRLFGIARHGLDFNVGLIEGVAVAASWSGQPLTPHQQVKVLRDAKLVTSETLAQVMSPRFFGINAGQAYAVAGSFCRFLLDQFGSERLMQLYRAAGSDGSYERIYGHSFAALRDQWLARVDAETVPPAERALVVERLERPSVFHRACAHALALARQAARAAAASGARARALAAFDQLCHDEPGDPQNLADAMDAALSADARVEARGYAEKLLARNDPAFTARALTTLGDLQLAAGDADAARAYYDRAARLPLDEAAARLLTVKRKLTLWPNGASRAALVQFLTAPSSSRDPALDLMTLQKLVDRDPDRALYHYLLARQLMSRGRFAEVVAELERPTVEPLPDARFDREAARLRGQALYRLGRYAEARALFDALAADVDAGEGARLEAAEWRARCDFALAHVPAPPPSTAAAKSEAAPQ